MCVCVYACMCVCTYACMHVCVYACMHVRMYAWPYVRKLRKYVPHDRTYVSYVSMYRRVYICMIYAPYNFPDKFSQF